MNSNLKRFLKKTRATQPINWIATSSIQAVLRGAGGPSELVIKHLHRVGVVTRTLPNGRKLKLGSKGDDWVSNQVFWRGWDGYEPETVPLFYRLATRASVTIDVGAYVGYFSLLAAHASPDGQVFAFEPLPSVYKRLLHNVALNGLTNVQCFSVAVGESEGQSDFWHVDVEIPTSSSLSFEFMEQAENLVNSKVQVWTLDQFVSSNQIRRIDLMKLDTESTEHQVLRGMTKTLERDHPLIISEVLCGRGGEEPLEEILRHFGYRFYHLTPQGPVHRTKVEGHPEWLNYLFTTHSPDEVAHF